MQFESKFKTFFKRLGLIVGVILMGCGICLTILPTQELTATMGTALMFTNKEVVYNDVPIIIPDFIPYTQIEMYLKYDPYTKEHIKLTSYYCPNHEKVSHKNGYCDLCDPETTLLKYQRGLHAPRDFFRNIFSSVVLKSEDGKKVIVQQVR